MKSSVLSQTMELKDCRDRWSHNEGYGCWCMEDVLYTSAATVPEFQRLSIFVPEAYMNADGTVNEKGQFGPYTAKTVPVVFENSCGGYLQMPNRRLGESNCYAQQYLERGFIYVTCGCRGRNSRDENGVFVGKAPMTLVDLKTAIRFLRHNRAVLPGNWEKIISVGCSAGGAMSSLLAVSGDNAAFDACLEENGAFPEESDRVFAAQIYCPIIDLEHADMAYEWMFQADKTCEDSHAGPAETMTPFQEALSRILSERYISYFNGMKLQNPVTGETLTLGQDGRSGTGYDYLMACLEASAAKYLRRLNSAEDYLAGKEAWLTWDGEHAHLASLDTYILHHRRRMKPCTAFDKLSMDSGENQEFGDAENDYRHFSPDNAAALEALKERFPTEYVQYFAGYAAVGENESLMNRVKLINPLSFIDNGTESRRAEHYRIRVGACDADTSFSVSMMLALKIANAGCGSVDYALVWDRPHCEADYPGEVCDWIDEICR